MPQTPTNADVAGAIQAAIDTQAMSLNRLEELSLISRRTISRKLAGQGAFTAGELALIAQALGMRGSDILAAAEVLAAA